MSAIFGIFHRTEQPVSRAALASMAEVMAHWGLDGSDIWTNGVVGLGHLQLHTTPESLHERLPLRHPAWPHLVITAAARIDNRAELCDRFGLRMQTELTDSELILHAYARWGEDCPRDLLGAYAFAIWDERNRSLFCARDHMGFHPFYHYAAPDLFVFASDVRGVLAVDGVPHRVDEDALFAARHYGSRELKERTPLHGIHKVAPAATLTVTPARLEQRTYWRPEDAPQLPARRLEEYAAALAEHLDRAIDACLRTAGPIGAHLSGGLDSSTVAVLAARRLREVNSTLAAAYSWSPPPQPADYPLHDERAQVMAVAEQEGLYVHFTAATPEDFAEIHRRDLSTQPTDTLVFESLVCRHAAGSGIRVLLSGWGGDEVATFNGDGYLAELLTAGKWRILWHELQLRRKRYEGRWLHVVQMQVIFPFLPDMLFRRVFRRPIVDRRRELTHKQQAMMRRNLDRTRIRRNVRQTQLSLLDNGHITHRIESWANYGADWGIEYRYPLLDRRLLEFCLGLPPEMTFQQGWKRYLVRYTFSSILPASVGWNTSKRDPAWLAAHQQISNE